MIKVLEFFNKRADLSHADFLAHWRGRHTSVVMGITGVRRYVQNPVRHDLTRDGPFDGVVELWFSSVGMMRANGQSPYWPEVIADEERFIDRTTTRLVLIDDPSPPPVKAGLRLFVLSRRAQGVSTEGFSAALEKLANRLAPLVDDRARPHIDRPFTRRAEAPFVHAVCVVQADLPTLDAVRREAPWTTLSELDVVTTLVTDCRPILVD